ncbi:MAG: hypothetical protein HUJ70_02265 [Pseudobutyrivibrio sp.]|nr:hypothetical protein [Pseudobutyrivibrio sp.]
MQLANDKVKEYTKRIMIARMRVLVKNAFFGLLLMHLKISLSDESKTSWTDGERLWINPDFLEQISDEELEYVLLHEILHIVLHHKERGIGLDEKKFDKAIDLVVNSTIFTSYGKDNKLITLKNFGGVQEHLSPNGREGCEYTAEELYNLLEIPIGLQCDAEGEEQENCNGDETGSGNSGWDDHSKLKRLEEDEILKTEWSKHLCDAAEAMSIRDPSNSRGLIPAFAEAIITRLKRPQTDWRTILSDFIQEEIADYSFAPPDRRFDDSPFFLPDFNEKEDVMKDILFMIDTSGSMSDDAITTVYSEIKGAIDQFDGKLKGWLGFFDAAVIEPKPFENEEEFRIIKPMGRGGTDFEIIFEYVASKMEDKVPASIIILTDGYAPFPEEEMAMGIPVLWLIINEEVNPPWGKVARVKVNDE